MNNANHRWLDVVKVYIFARFVFFAIVTIFILERLQWKEVALAATL